MSRKLPPVRQEDDKIRGVLVFASLMGTMLFIALCVFVNWLLWRADTLAFNPEALKPVKEVIVRPAAIGGVNQTLINVDSSTRHLNTQRRLSLEEHRWTDQPAGVAQIPIDAAMRALVAGTTASLGAIAGREAAGAPASGAEAGGGSGSTGSPPGTERPQ